MPANHTPTGSVMDSSPSARAGNVRNLCHRGGSVSIDYFALAALTPLLTRQAVNDALAGNPARLPWLAPRVTVDRFF